MKTLSVALPAALAAALVLSGCAKSGGDANATALNDTVLNESDGADANLSATESLDGNASDANLTEASSNAL